MKNAIGFPNAHPLDSDLAVGYLYQMFEQPGPVFNNNLDTMNLIRNITGKKGLCWSCQRLGKRMRYCIELRTNF